MQQSSDLLQNILYINIELHAFLLLLGFEGFPKAKDSSNGLVMTHGL